MITYRYPNIMIFDITVALLGISFIIIKDILKNQWYERLFDSMFKKFLLP